MQSEFLLVTVSDSHLNPVALSSLASTSQASTPSWVISSPPLGKSLRLIPKNPWTLQWWNLVLKIATFEGSGFLGIVIIQKNKSESLDYCINSWWRNSCTHTSKSLKSDTVIFPKKISDSFLKWLRKIRIVKKKKLERVWEQLLEIVFRQVSSKNDVKNGALRRVGFQILGVTGPGEMEVLIIPVNPQK